MLANINLNQPMGELRTGSRLILPCTKTPLLVVGNLFLTNAACVLPT